MSDLSTLRSPKRTFADHSKFMVTPSWRPAAKAERAVETAQTSSCPSCQSVAIGVVDLDPKSKAKSAHLVPHEGRIAIVTDAGWDAVDAGGASDEGAGLRTAKSCGPDASTLASSLRD